MPNAKTQRLLFFFGFVGVITSCFGCGLAFNNQIGAAQVALIVAWLILVPLFGYLISTRRRLKKGVRGKGGGPPLHHPAAAAHAPLLPAWLILVPLFGYLISTRRRLKKVVRRKEALQQE